MTTGPRSGRMRVAWNSKWNVDGGALLFLLVMLPVYTSAVLHICPLKEDFFGGEKVYLLVPDGGDLLTVRSDECDASDFMNVTLSQPEHDSSMIDALGKQWTWIQYWATTNTLYVHIGLNSTHFTTYISHNECLISHRRLFFFNNTPYGRLCPNAADMRDICMLTDPKKTILPDRTIFLYSVNSTDTLRVHSEECDISIVTNIELKDPANDTGMIDIYGHRWTTMVYTLTPNTLHIKVADNVTGGSLYSVNTACITRSKMRFTFNATFFALKCSNDDEVVSDVWLLIKIAAGVCGLCVPVVIYAIKKRPETTSGAAGTSEGERSTEVDGAVSGVGEARRGGTGESVELENQ